MSYWELGWWALVAFITIGAFVYFAILWRRRSLSSKLGPLDAPQAANDAPPPSKASVDKEKTPIHKEASIWWTGVLLAACGLVFLFGIQWPVTETPQLSGVGSKVLKNWLPLTAIVVLLFIVIALNAKKLEAVATVLLWSLGVLTVGAIIVAIVSVWTTRNTAPQAAVALPQDTPNLPRAWKADGTATDMSTWLKLKVPAHGDSQHVPGLYGGHVVWGGSGFSVRCVYADGHEGVVSEGTCGDGNIAKSYARNNGGTDLWASYAYAKADEK